jgi:hypothetical protein
VRRRAPLCVVVHKYMDKFLWLAGKEHYPREGDQHQDNRQMRVDMGKPAEVICPRGPQRMMTEGPIRAALYRYGNAAIKPIYLYFHEETSLREVLQQEQAAREQLIADLAALGKRLPSEPLAHFYREVRRAGELWGLGQVNSNQARHMWKGVAHQAQKRVRALKRPAGE